MLQNAERAHSLDDRIVIPALGQQLTLLGFEPEPQLLAEGTYFDAPTVDLDSYDHIIVCASGGKDSIACLLALIEQGVDLARVELWHHRRRRPRGQHPDGLDLHRQLHAAVRRSIRGAVVLQLAARGHRRRDAQAGRLFTAAYRGNSSGNYFPGKGCHPDCPRYPPPVPSAKRQSGHPLVQLCRQDRRRPPRHHQPGSVSRYQDPVRHR